MSSHAIIGTVQFNFEFWRGDAPPLIHEQAIVHTRPGADGVAIQNIGKWSEPITAILESHFASYQAALAVLPLYYAVPGSGLIKVVYNNRDWQTSYGIKFNVDAIRFLNARQNVRLVGPGYDWPLGGSLITEWRLTAVAV